MFPDLSGGAGLAPADSNGFPLSLSDIPFSGGYFGPDANADTGVPFSDGYFGPYATNGSDTGSGQDWTALLGFPATGTGQSTGGGLATRSASDPFGGVLSQLLGTAGQVGSSFLSAWGAQQVAAMKPQQPMATPPVGASPLLIVGGVAAVAVVIVLLARKH